MRSRAVLIRLTEEEYDAVTTAARAAGVRVATYAAQVTVAAATAVTATERALAKMRSALAEFDHEEER